MSAYKELINKFYNYGMENEKIESIIMIGSRARKERHGDAYADLDMIFSVSDPDYFIKSDYWLQEIGDVRISFVENAFIMLKERRVLFEGGLDVDIAILPTLHNKSISEDPLAISILQKGYRILLDKTGFFTKALSDLPEESLPELPNEFDFSNTVKDFWYHLVWTTKKLQRGELWAAKFCLDNYMKQQLLWIIECCMHIRKGINYNTWYGGRFLDFWVDKDIHEDLERTFSAYSSADMLRALTENMVLFRRLAKEAAKALSYSYPIEADSYATKLVHSSIQKYQGSQYEDSNNVTDGENL